MGLDEQVGNVQSYRAPNVIVVNGEKGIEDMGWLAY